MGNCVKGTRSDVVATVEAHNSTEEDGRFQINHTFSAAGSSNQGSAYSMPETEPTIYNWNGSEATANISDLPVELLVKVVRQIYIRRWKGLELVNRHFRAAVLMAWEELRSIRLDHVFGVDFGDEYTFGKKAFREQELLKNFLETLAVRSPFITEYDESAFIRSDISSLAVQAICRFENVTRLVLHSFERPDNNNSLMKRTLDTFFRHLNIEQSLSKTLQTSLSRMTLRELVYRSSTVDEGKCLLSMNCGQLTSLDLACSKIDFKITGQLLLRCKKLAHLDLSATEIKPMELQNDNLFIWLRTANCLVSLRMNFFGMHHNSKYDAVWHAELQRSLFDLGSFETLTELEMMDSCFCTDTLIDVITDRLANSLKILRFDIVNCSEIALLKLATKLVKLEQLHFWSYKNALRYGSLSNKISDKVVSAITANLSELRALDLCRPSASADALKNLIVLEKLQHLSVIGSFNDETLITVASALGHQLVTLEIPMSSYISDKGIVAAAKYLQNVRHLVLSGTDISDKSLTALACFCPELRTLAMIGCGNISSRGAKIIISFCHKISRLCVRGSAVDARELMSFHRIWSKFQLVTLSDTFKLCYSDQYSDSLKSSYSMDYWYWRYFQPVLWQRMP